MHEELLNRLKNLATLEVKNGESVIHVTAEAAECIKEIAHEAADAIEVRHGKWIWFGDCSNEGLYCSVCRSKIHNTKTPKKKLSNYCPNCGAKMDESEDEE